MARAPALAELLVFDCELDAPRLALPRPEVQVVVRFGPSIRQGVDVHAFGAREQVHRKLIRAGHRSVTARLQLGMSAPVLGVPASELSGRIAPLEDLWGGPATQRLLERLAQTRDTVAAAAVLDKALGERLTRAGNAARLSLAAVAADKLACQPVSAVAMGLGLSERHFRRLFQEAVGMGPKAFAKLARFQRALAAARADAAASWARIAAEAGYYDQAHLIAEFRAIAGVTPRALLSELGRAPSLG